MVLSDLIKVAREDQIRRITVLGYYKTSKKYYSFRTAFDREYGDNLHDCACGLFNNEVKSILVGHGDLDIDLIEWIDDSIET